ncbi:MAG: hypothetical protein OXH50_01135 [Gemmatimonadetes bacterium]|nr:hypothetical protein [Gemmatimonadota bacterium]
MTSENSSANVAMALEMLVEEVEKEIGFVNRDGADAFVSGDHGVARKSLQRSEDLTAGQSCRSAKGMAGACGVG